MDVCESRETSIRLRMNHLRLLDPDSPPGNPLSRYKDTETGWTSKHATLAGLIATARLHRESNGLAVPDDFAFQVETQLCQSDPERCVSRDGTPPDLTCIHRGALIRWEGCETCGGWRGAIMACALHGECSLFKHELPPARPCWSCGDRVSALT